MTLTLPPKERRREEEKKRDSGKSEALRGEGF